MLEPAYLHKEALQGKYARAIGKPENFYYFLGPYHGYELSIDNDSYNNLQFASVSKKENGYVINGYLCANINRDTNHVDNMQFLRFRDSTHDDISTFPHDLVKFLESLFGKYQFRKIEWCVVVGNPAEKMYDRIISKWGGSIAGIFKEHVRLPDGKLYDLKYYEIFKSAYDVQAKKNRSEEAT